VRAATAREDRNRRKPVLFEVPFGHLSHQDFLSLHRIMGHLATGADAALQFLEHAQEGSDKQNNR
jgi:hypothetical protein